MRKRRRKIKNFLSTVDENKKFSSRNSKKLILGMICLYISTFLFIATPSVTAVSIMNFDTYTTGDQVSETWLTTETQTGDTQITDEQSKSGDLSYKLNKVSIGGKTWFNFTDTTFNTLEFYFYPTIAGSDADAWFDFYLWDNVGVELFLLRFETDDPNTFSCRIHTGVVTDIIPDTDKQDWDDEWHKVVMSRIGDNQINISVFDTSDVFYGGQTVTIKKLWSFWNGTMSIHATNQANLHQLYIDNFVYNKGGSYVESPDYAVIGDYDFDWELLTTIGNRYWNQVRDSPITGTLKRFEIPIPHCTPTYCYNQYGFPELCINGNPLGEADYIYEYAMSNNGVWADIMVWDDLDINFDDENLVFEIDMHQLGYFFITAPEGIDADGDSIVSELSVHNIAVAHCNGMSGGDGIWNREHLYKFYYVSSSPYDPLDDAITAPNTVVDNKTLKISYTVNKSLSVARITVSDAGGIEYLNETAIDEFGAKFYHANDGTGTYTITLRRDGVTIDTLTFTVTASSSQYKLYCLKTEFLRDEQFDIYYSYNRTYNYNNTGYIRIVDYEGKEVSGRSWGISTDDWEVYTITGVDLDKIGNYKIELGYLVSGTFIILPEGGFSLDIISTLRGRATVDVSPNTIFLGETVSIDGKNPFTGTADTVEIKIVETGESWDATGINAFSYEYTPQSIGTFHVQFIYSNATMDEDIFVVNKRPGETSNLVGLIKIAIPDPTTRGIVGMAIALVITFLPFIFAMKMKQHHVTINIPPILYTVTFLIGVVIIGMLGFIGWEIMFFLCFIVIAVLIGLWLQGKGSTSEG